MEDCNLFNFIVWGVGGIALCCFGYTVNLLSLIALQRDVRTPASTLLQSLAVSDLVLLVCVGVTESVPYVCDYTRACRNVWSFWPHIRLFWYLVPVSHMCSIWLVVLIAGNRYWAVCRPHAAVQAWTNRRTNVYIACVVFGVVAFNVPRAFEYQVVACNVNETKMAAETKMATDAAGRNDTALSIGSKMEFEDENDGPMTGNNMADGIPTSRYNDDIISISTERGEERVAVVCETKTAFGARYYYSVGYKVVLVNCLLILLPLGFLLFSSVWIIRSLHLTNRTSLVKKRRASSRHESTTSGVGVGDDERRTANPSREVTFLLVTVVLVAVACQTPLAVFHFARYSNSSDCGDVVFYLDNISKFLVNLNSCLNFVVYCILGPRFRRLLLLALTCSPRKGPPPRGRLSRTKADGGVTEAPPDERKLASLRTPVED